MGCDMLMRQKINEISDYGYASVSELATYLGISKIKIPAATEGVGLKSNRAAKFAWTDIWSVYWHIRHVPHEYSGQMLEPLLDSKVVADLLGVSSRTIRRAGDAGDPKYRLPRHLDLGPRLRRYHPLMINRWSHNCELDAWLMPAPAARRPAPFGLTPRASFSGQKP